MAEGTGVLAEAEVVFVGAAEAEVAVGNRHECYGHYGCGSGNQMSKALLETGYVTCMQTTWSPLVISNCGGGDNKLVGLRQLNSNQH